ncbi:hypothetical protein EYF80_029167 [Liparis tanakae]|uniref:Uncharacterized protein n=1 Tax=Liparis tanakae TaxID=230148 RepID=A0A4Z2H431_9TELE|nr:hypothetical protein EYF80_029167 [Liparis tanakae]
MQHGQGPLGATQTTTGSSSEDEYRQEASAKTHKHTHTKTHTPSSPPKIAPALSDSNYEIKAQSQRSSRSESNRTCWRAEENQSVRLHLIHRLWHGSGPSSPVSTTGRGSARGQEPSAQADEAARSGQCAGKGKGRNLLVTHATKKASQPPPPARCASASSDFARTRSKRKRRKTGGRGEKTNAMVAKRHHRAGARARVGIWGWPSPAGKRRRGGEIRSHSLQLIAAVTFQLVTTVQKCRVMCRRRQRTWTEAPADHILHHAEL